MAIRIVKPAQQEETGGSRVRVVKPAAKTGYDKVREQADKAYAGWGRPLNALQGATLGWADEAFGAVAGATAGAANALSRGFGGDGIGVTADEARQGVTDAVRARTAQQQKERPVDSLALNLAGGAVTGGVGAKAVAGAKTLGQAAIRSGVVGAGYGAVAGAGTAKEGKRVEGAVVGGTIGAATGAALPVVTRAAQSTGRAINAATGYRLTGGPQGAAASRLREALFKDGMDEQQINQVMQQYAETGAMPPALVDVAGENTRALIRFAGSRPGEARQAAQGYRDTTMEAIPDASINRARQLTPNEPRPAAEFQAGIEEARGIAARTDYAPAYAQPVQIDAQTASALRGDTGRAAIQRARQAAAARRDFQQMQELDSLLSSNMDEFPTVSAGTLDRVRIAMGERAQTATQRGARDMASGIKSRAADINSTLDSVPELGPARANFRASSEAIDAVDAGQRVLKDAPDAFAAAINQSNPQAVEAARVGARQAITDALGQRSNAAPVLRQIAFAPNAKRNLTALFGEDEANRFIEAARLNLQKGQRADFIAPNTNSQTFSRGQDASMFTSAIDAVRRPVQKLLERVAAGFTITDAEAAELVRIGVMSPQQASAAIRPRVPAASTNANIGRATAATTNALAQRQ